MKTTTLIIALITPLLLMGCTSEYKEVHASDLPAYIFGVDPLYHTVYVGSDNSFHYVVWESGKSSGKIKVPKSELSLSREFPLGSSNTFLFKTKDGRIDDR